LRAAVVGTGIAGLAGAIFLRRAGWDVDLVERAGEPAPLGSGLLSERAPMRGLRCGPQLRCLPARREFLATLTGYKAGILLGRLK
jgi:2-polyprenyl-6-methoxyphenol hydroxylase-like FAD-dependent oxidoreductase